MVFSKDTISLITRVINGAGVKVEYQDSDSGGNLDGDNWKISVDETWLANEITAKSNTRLSAADSDRISAIEKLLNISTTMSGTMPATSSTKTITTNLGTGTALTGNLNLTWNIVSGDGIKVFSQPEIIATGATGASVLRLLAARINATSYTTSATYAAGAITVGFADSRSDWTVSITDITSSNSVSFTVSN